MHKVDGSLDTETNLVLRHAAQLRTRPDFNRATRIYTSGILRFCESQRLINKLISHEARLRVIGYLLYLAADRATFGPLGGATYGRLHDYCARHYKVSPRVLKTTLALLKFSSFIEAQPSPTDRRISYYQPTAKMLDFARERLVYTFCALDLIEPEAKRHDHLQSDPNCLEHFIVSSGRASYANTPPADHIPDYIDFLGAYEGATPVMFSILEASRDSDPTPSRAAIAKRFGISKTQVGNVINEGTRLGYLTLDAAASPRPTKSLTDDHHLWVSIEFAFFARHIET